MPTPTTSAPKTLDVDEALDLADDLLRQLAEHLGDLDQLNSVFLRWHTVLDNDNFSKVCIAALHTTFTECLTHTPSEQIPDGSHVYLNPKDAA